MTEWTNADRTGDASPEFASFWVRAGAAILDTVLFIPVVLLSQYNIFTVKSFFLELLLACLWLIYKPYMEYQYGATLGKMAFKLRVIGEDLQRITLDQSVKRFAFYFLGYLGAILVNYWSFHHPDFASVENFEQLAQIRESFSAEFIANVANIPIFVSIVAVIFDPQKQALHDQLAQTYCVYHRQ
ncbi:MAG: RDD family protein [Bacteroidota bacterium]